jgi:hypothetical protein
MVQFSDIIGQLDDLNQQVENLLAGFTEKQLNWRPAPGKWSILECVGHLVQTGRAYVPKIRRALDGAGRHAPGEQKGITIRWFVFPLLRWMEPPYRLKIPTVAIFTPAGNILPDQVGRDFMEMNQSLSGQLQRAQSLDLRGIRVFSPYSRWVRFTPLEIGAFLSAHERRHLWQAQQVSQMPGFPGDI